MAKLPPWWAGGPGRGTGLKGQWVQRTWRGKPIIQAWPRRQPRPRTQAEADNRKTLATAARAIIYFDAYQQVFAAGVARSSQLLPRDLLMQAIFTRGPAPMLKTGKKYFSMPAMMDISELLDAIGQLPGDMMFRGPDWWTRIPAGNLGDILTMSADDTPLWAPPPSPSGGNSEIPFQQPNATPFVLSTSLAPDTPVFTPFMLQSPKSASEVRYLTLAPSAPRTAYAALYAADPFTGWIDGAPLIAQGPATAIAAGVNHLSLGAVVSLAPATWYWMGLIMQGTGTLYSPATWAPTQVNYWNQPSSALPATAPATNVTQANWPWWLA